MIESVGNDTEIHVHDNEAYRIQDDVNDERDNSDGKKILRESK